VISGVLGVISGVLGFLDSGVFDFSRVVVCLALLLFRMFGLLLFVFCVTCRSYVLCDFPMLVLVSVI